ncbi:MAG: tetratricopeptide repeat protein [Candidatus Kapabacteria bacterium]|nr:tetratricopeptide repeat protein [Candidatus Kapabacteria bacterium]
MDTIKADIEHAITIRDAGRLKQLAGELHDVNSVQARALRHSALGQAFALHGEHANALEHFRIALDESIKIGDRVDEARLTGSIGNVLKSVGDYTSALEHYHRALGMFEKLGDSAGMAVAAAGIGIVHWFNANYVTTLEYFYRSLSEHEKNDDVANSAIVIGNIGLVLLATGDYDAALEQFEKAHSLHELRGARHSVAHALGNIGSARWKSKDYDGALHFMGQALQIHMELENKRGIALISGNILSVHVDMGNTKTAIELLAKLDELQIDDPNVGIERELNRARIQESHQEYESADATLQSALAKARDHGLRAWEAEIHGAIRDRAQQRNDFAAYLEHNSAHIRITEEVNGRETASKLAIQAKQREIDAREREHQKHMAVLHSTLPKHIADRVARGETVNDSFDHASVLFLDVVGFTSNTSELDASTVVALLHNMFTAFDAICAEHNVVKIKTIGDSYLAVAFGPEDSEQRIANSEQRIANSEQRIANSEQRMANVARAMMKCSYQWPHTGERIVFRIGLHCGPIVAGVLGTERMQYDVWGDTVNVASRMESTCEPGRIHASAGLASALGAPIVIHERGMIEIKGKGPMKTFWLG